MMMAAMMLPALAPVGVLYAGDGEGRVARTSGLEPGISSSGRRSACSP